MNNLSLNISQSDTLWYTPMDHHHHHHHHNQHQQKPFPLFYTQLSQNDDESDNSSSNNHNYTSVGPTNDNRSETASSQSHHSDQHHREHMFEKPLTPSDVGKLNRLVIPKQHAEKYFPLAGVSSSSAASAAADGGGGGGGGVILGFEDETGKCWRFRYSYWNSSQSYVLTKGWSRYVKEKKLDAGDVVLFERHRFEPERFFIGWRRRGSGSSVQFPVRVDEFGSGRWTGGGGAVQRTSYYNGVQVRQGYPVPHPHRISVSSYPYHHPPADCFHAPPGTEIRQQQESQKAAARSSDGGANSKTLRLFGVNLECQLDDGSIEPEPEPQTSDGSSISSQGAVHGSGSGSAPGQGFVGPTGYNYFDYVNYHHPPSHQHQHHNNHMDINYAQDVNQMRNRLG